MNTATLHSRWPADKASGTAHPTRLRRALRAVIALALTALTWPALASDRDVLINLYNSTNGAGWKLNSGWNTNTSECTWYGVSCDAQKRVTYIELGGNQLSGSLPSSLNQLTALQGFLVENNQLTGPIPSLAGLSALGDFRAGNNLFTGSIPNLDSLTSLLSFHVDGNQLIGTPPAAPPSLAAGNSSLCPNFLSTPSPTDAAWDTATGSTLLHWSNGCITPPPEYAATPIAGAHGSISPGTQTAQPGGMLTFTVSPDPGFMIDLVSGCGGQLQGNVYTTAPMTANCNVTALFKSADRLVLIDLYNSTNGANWTKNTGWNTAASECTWLGVTCNIQGRVTGIDLHDNNLIGSLPSTLNKLAALSSFKAYNNQLAGTIPDLAGLTALRWFWVNNNKLTGSIPDLVNLTAMTSFWADANQITGPIPSLTGLKQLQTFSVVDNQLTGAIPGLSGLTALENFSVYNNKLTGSIPDLAGLTALRLFSVYKNQLTGPIPDLAGLTALTEFRVNANLLSGTIPNVTGHANLQAFVVDNNQLTGALPSLEGLTGLIWFYARGNKLTGSIPSLSGLTKLQDYMVAENQLTGPIPDLSGLTKLIVFGVYTNQLSGSIPNLSGLPALRHFLASDNKLTGSIPSLAGLTVLQSFSVSRNRLTGFIPSFSGLTALTNFHAGGNQLTGAIPSFSGLKALQNFSAEVNQLTGAIPDLSDSTALQSLWIHTNQLTGTLPAAPSTLEAKFSSLCPNFLVSPSPTDAAWNIATGFTPWSNGCIAPPDYTAKPVAGPHGAMSPDTPQTAKPGDIVTFTVSPGAGYLIDQVSGCNGTLQGSIYKTEPMIGNCDVTASFKAAPGTPVDYIATPVAGLNGAISPALPQTVTAGTAITFTLSPNSGYVIDQVSGCGGSLQGNAYTTAPMSADCTVTASFKAAPVVPVNYTVTPVAGPNGAISPAMPQTVTAGTAVTFTLTPNSGYVIDQVSGCGGSLQGNAYTTAPMSADCTVTASFKTAPGVPVSYTVTPVAGSHGAINPAVPQTVTAGTAITFTLSPNSGYVIDQASGCGGSLQGNTYTTAPMSANCTVTAGFKAAPVVPVNYTVTPVAGSHGAINPAVPQTVNAGTAITFTLNPNSGYVIDQVSGCGGSLQGNAYTTAPMSANCTVTASFRATSTVPVANVVSAPALGTWALTLITLIAAGLGARRLTETGSR